MTRVGVVRNPRSHANLRGAGAPIAQNVRLVEPLSPDALLLDLRSFASEGVDFLVIDGGDGTVREVLSALPQAYGDRPPVLAVLASGKTNVLALDLGPRRGWSLDTILGRLEAERLSYKTRSPLEVSWVGGSHPPVRGFVFGLGAFVRATQMAQSVHRMGAYHSLSVAVTLAGAVIATLLGGGQWRQGVELTAQLDDAPTRRGARFGLLATTLKRLPFGLRPFGDPNEALKVLDVDAPARRFALAALAILMGRKAAWLEGLGYRRAQVERMSLSCPDSIIVDGELFSGGEILVRRGPAMRFLAP